MDDDVLFQKLLKVLKETPQAKKANVVEAAPPAQQPVVAAAAILSSKTDDDMVDLLRKILASEKVAHVAQKTALNTAFAAASSTASQTRQAISQGLTTAKEKMAIVASDVADRARGLWAKRNVAKGFVASVPCRVTEFMSAIAETSAEGAQKVSQLIGPYLDEMKIKARPVFHSRLGEMNQEKLEFLRKSLSPEKFAEVLKGLGARPPRVQPDAARYMANLGIPSRAYSRVFEAPSGTGVSTRTSSRPNVVLTGPGVSTRTSSRPNVDLPRVPSRPSGLFSRPSSRTRMDPAAAKAQAQAAEKAAAEAKAAADKAAAEKAAAEKAQAQAAVSAAAAPAPATQNNKFKNLDKKSLDDLIRFRKANPANKNKVNTYIEYKMERLLRNAGAYGTSSLKTAMRHLRNVPNLPGRDRIIETVRARIDEIEYRTRNDPRRALEKLRNLKRDIGSGNQNIRSMFSNAERNYQRRVENERRRRMNENRERRGLEPLPVPPSRNRLPPLGNVPMVLNPPPNQTQPNLRPRNNYGPLPPPPPLPVEEPPLNMGEIKAINNAGGANKALNLVTNAGGPNNVLRAANQLKEAGNNPNLAIAKGADPKNVRIVLQLGGANNASKVAAATPKLRRRRRRRAPKKTVRKTKAAPRVKDIKKILRHLGTKEDLLKRLPKNDRAKVEKESKNAVATRLTSYLLRRTKKK